MPDGLYERDVLAWSERQADLLRRLAAGERLNEPLDWPNLIDEVESVGLSELKSCQSLLRQALLHVLKLHAWPESRAAGHWLDEAAGFLIDARDRYSPSMRQKIELPVIYADAVYRLRIVSDRAGEPRPVPEACPFKLDDLLAVHADVSALVRALGNS